jgi:hypothetical protein
MAQNGNFELVATSSVDDFRPAIAVNAAAYLDLALPESIAAGRTCRARLKTLAIISEDNVGWEVWLFNRKTLAAEPSVLGSTFAGFWGFAVGDAVRIGAAGLYYYYVDGLDIPYETLDLLANGAPDENLRRFLHMALVARTNAKVINTMVKVRMNFEPTLGW